MPPILGVQPNMVCTFCRLQPAIKGRHREPDFVRTHATNNWCSAKHGLYIRSLRWQRQVPLCPKQRFNVIGNKVVEPRGSTQTLANSYAYQSLCVFLQTASRCNAKRRRVAFASRCNAKRRRVAFNKTIHTEIASMRRAFPLCHREAPIPCHGDSNLTYCLSLCTPNGVVWG